ncbi:lysophospholipid acyltransferase family protein [Granulicella paludicola]|uniref:lysophospholipid acyltransferase family protein n=1 Tax=Granulicella paludicola TaxID=474951 RepID=UPI0021DF45F6|nr:lysophospholipid acyltransferase family protein [Granulicella paludicola]
MQHRVEYCALRLLVAAIGVMPRRVARAVGAALGTLVRVTLSRLRQTGLQNLAMALPETTAEERERILNGVYRSLGWELAEFCKMSRYTATQASMFIRYAGLENYLAARDRGKGVLVLTGHLGAWELSSFYHSLVGYPMSMVIRKLDNPLVDAYVNRIRCLHGNRVIHKDDFARGLLTAMNKGETVGILMDTNMTPPQGVFVPFFGVPACTATAMARIALRSDAAVIPGFLLWEASERKYVLRFGPQIELVRTGDAQADIVANTALFTAVTESYIRRYPEQWLWVHRRWKTRPPGEERLYR